MKKKNKRTEEILYPFAMESTTVGGVLKRLRLTRGLALHRQIKDGSIRVNGRKVSNSYHRVRSGDVIFWNEYRIKLHRDEHAKSQRLMQELLRSGGFRGGGTGGRAYGSGGGFGGGGGR